ncbi:MAG: cytochrome c oxidase subunit II [Bryobacteraceae bacterium]
MNIRPLKLAATLLIPAMAFALEEKRIANMFNPLATPADEVVKMAILSILICGAIFLVVAGLLVFIIFKFRRRPGDDAAEPPQVYGSNQIEIAWTVIPILIVFVLIMVTARVVSAVQNKGFPGDAIHATVIGHQWWWELRYPELGIVTANELHVPVSSTSGGLPTVLTLQSVDVIHSFWIPQLAGKTDVIPNRDNHMWIDPREPGVYFGNCAEYCGTQHANMLIRVVVHPQAEFDAWVANEKKPAVNDPAGAQGRATFESLSCVNCHAIRGTIAAGAFGPDLTHIMSRQVIASGALTNTPEHLRAWIHDPDQAKPGSLMPAMQLSDLEVDQIVSYLETLK